MRLLIVLPGALGDVVRGLPLLERLRHGLPAAHLAWLVESPSAPLLAGHPWLDAVHVLERRGGVHALWRAARALRRSRYDVALDLGRGAKSAALVRASGAPRRVGLARADAREGSWLAATEHLPVQGVERSKLEQFLAFADRLEVPPRPIAFGLAPSEEERAAAAALLQGLPEPLVVASLGSSCPSRRWLPERTAAVLDVLASVHAASIVLTGVRDDAAFAGAVVDRMRTRSHNLVGRTSLRELLAVLARARVVLGPDSGTLHLAAALRVPVVSLWGATSAARSTPWGAERGVVQGHAACVPCFLRTCPIGRVCMQSITTDAVLAAVREALAA